MVFASTMLVHAPAKPGKKIDEYHLIDPPWAYTRSEVRAEAIVADEHGELQTVALRSAGIHNDDSSAAFLCQQITLIYERLPPPHLYATDLDRGQPYLRVERPA